MTGGGAAIPRVVIVGGGLAGLAAAAALGSIGFEVDLHEARPFLGGRATSFPLNPAEDDSEHIDNCQHVLLRCFTNLLDFYRRAGVGEKIRFYDRLYFVRPGGATDVLKPGRLPAPAHLLGSLLGFRGLSPADKRSILSALAAMRRERNRADLDALTIAEWLASHGATQRAVTRFWRPILVSALNEEPERASAGPAFQVFLEGLMASRDSYEMGIPAVPLGELYSSGSEGRFGESVRFHLRSPVERLDPTDRAADFYISAVPFERVNALIPELELPLEKFEHSPITGVHLWFDREVTKLPHAVLLDRTMQWMFRKSATYVQCVVSASRSLVPLSREQIIETGAARAGRVFPGGPRRQARQGPRHQGSPSDVLDRPGPRCPSPARGDEVPEYFSSRRLDPHRLASHDGGSRAERLSGGGSRGEGGGPGDVVCFGANIPVARTMIHAPARNSR